MIILGIESSCDDTATSLIQVKNNKIKVLAESTASQIDVHKKYGGVVPEIAGRKHAEKIIPVIEGVLEAQKKPDVIAVTCGPGLMTGLLVGMEAAKTLSYLWDIPLVRVNHIEGHIYSTLNLDLDFPALCITVSGGHTELIIIKDHGKYELVGKTRDDAAGECFDKVAKLIGFDYPGGPKISEYAKKGDPNAIPFPRPMIDDESFDFSFAGLKTAALYWLRDNADKKNTTYNLELRTLDDFCASFEQSIVDVLVTKTIRAAKKFKPKTIILAGGVSANQKLKETLNTKISKHCHLSTFYFPLSTYSMDNATMIAAAGYHHAIKKDYAPWQKLEANPNWRVYDKNEFDDQKEKM